ncbi:elongation factor P [Candidatus Microgenomates bacterium]|nr:elongation factor P [Candidatus Microgenomates bacterium]
MISVTDLRAGTAFQMDGNPYVVLRYSHTKLGRGGATVRVSVRNLKTGNVEEKAFGAGQSVEEAPVAKKRMQYLYSDGKTIVFMDPTTFEQFEMRVSIIGDKIYFLKDGEMVQVLFWGSEALDIELPPKIDMKVVEAPPGIKGNSATNMWKQAKLENGLTVKVPLFINMGDMIRVDTRTSEYVERVK